MRVMGDVLVSVVSLGGRCEVCGVVICWEMLGLWVGSQFVCVVGDERFL